MKLHEGKLSLRHASEDQNPIRQPVQLFQKDLAGLPARSLLSSPAACVLRSVLVYTRPRKTERVAVSCGQSSVSLLARTSEECTTFHEVCYELIYESGWGSAQITGAICFTQIRVSVLFMTQKHCAIVSARQLQTLRYILCTRCETDSALKLTLPALTTDTVHQRCPKHRLRSQCRVKRQTKNGCWSWVFERGYSGRCTGVKTAVSAFVSCLR